MSTTKDIICLFLPRLSGGGAERVFINLAQGLIDCGKNVDFVLGKREGAYQNQIPEGVRILELNASRSLYCIPGLIKYLIKNKPKAIITGLDHVNIVAIIAKILSLVNAKLVITLHDTYSEKIKNEKNLKTKLSKILIKYLYPLADIIVAVSHGVAHDYSDYFKINKDKINVIYNPVINKKIFELSHEKIEHPWFSQNSLPIIISVGRLSAQKNFDLLINAFAQVNKEIPSNLIILGEGELRESLTTSIREKNLEHHVIMPGFVINPYSYMAKSSLFVLSSTREGLPTVLIEALAVGTPVVSTNCHSGPAEILNNGQFGTLTPPGDARSLAEAIITSLHRGKTEISREAWQRFEFSCAVNAYLQVIEANHGK